MLVFGHAQLKLFHVKYSYFIKYLKIYYFIILIHSFYRSLSSFLKSSTKFIRKHCIIYEKEYGICLNFLKTIIYLHEYCAILTMLYRTHILICYSYRSFRVFFFVITWWQILFIITPGGSAPFVLRLPTHVQTPQALNAR